MENATKALLIAAAVLLLVLLLSLMSYVFRQIGSNAGDIYSMLDESEITEYNQMFLNYDGRDDLTIQDVVSIINLAKDNKQISDVSVNISINITWADSSKNENIDIDSYPVEEILKEKLEDTDTYTYSCSVDYLTNTKLVGSVYIKETKAEKAT